MKQKVKAIMEAAPVLSEDMIRSAGETSKRIKKCNCHRTFFDHRSNKFFCYDCGRRVIV